MSMNLAIMLQRHSNINGSQPCFPVRFAKALLGPVPRAQRKYSPKPGNVSCKVKSKVHLGTLPCELSCATFSSSMQRGLGSLSAMSKS